MGLSRFARALAAIASLAASGFGCGLSNDLPSPASSESSVNLQFKLDPSLVISSFSYEVSLADGAPIRGTIPLTDAGANVSLFVGGLAPGQGYQLSLNATTDDGGTFCGAVSVFDVAAHAVTALDISMVCLSANTIRTIEVDGSPHVCPVLASYTVAESAGVVTLSASGYAFDDGPLSFAWETTGGTLTSPNQAVSRFSCGPPGDEELRVTVSDGSCNNLGVFNVTCPIE